MSRLLIPSWGFFNLRQNRCFVVAQMRNTIAPWFLCNTNIQCQEFPTLVFFEWYSLIMNTGASMVQRPNIFMVLEHPRWSSVFQAGLSHVCMDSTDIFFRWETIKKTTYSSWTGTQENTGWKIWCTYQPLNYWPIIEDGHHYLRPKIFEKPGFFCRISDAPRSTRLVKRRKRNPGNRKLLFRSLGCPVTKSFM